MSNPHSAPPAEQLDQEFEERPNFEQLISGLSARFINLPADQVDGAIEAALQQICESLGLERSGLWQISEQEQNILHITHTWAAPGVQPNPKRVVAKAFPWIIQKIFRNEIVIISRIEDLPDEAAGDKENLHRVGLKSTIAIPFSIGGMVIGGLSFGALKQAREWPTQLVQKLRLVAEIFAHAIYRKRAEQEISNHLAKLESQYQFERLISEFSARFVNILPDQVDREIENALQQILAFFQADRCGLLRVSRDKNEVHLDYICYADEGIQRMPVTINYMDMFPWNGKKVLSGETVSIRLIDLLPPEAAIDRQSAELLGLRSYLALPLMMQGSVDFIIVIDTVRSERNWPEEVIPRLRLAGEIFVNALERKRTDEELKKSYREINELKDRLQAESDYLRAEVKLAYRHGAIIGESAAIKKVLSQVEQVAATEAIVLIQGETGTGKELIAEAIHNHSRRKDRVMVKVNCATLPPPLVESELFGRERGAYTGALTKQAGRFEVANGSTIFLDEIGEMPLELQAKLLRVLQNGEFERLGSPKTVKVDVRVIAATNRDLAEAMRTGNFREDLYYRLKVFPILVPPLRERAEDIPLLAWAFVNEFGKKMGKKIQKIPQKTMEALQRYSWPGNIRELRNVIENAMILSAGSTLLVQAFDQSNSIKPATLTLEETERRHIFAVLEKTNWRVKGANGAAQLLGLKPGTLYAKMHKLGIPHGRQKGLNIDQKSK